MKKTALNANMGTEVLRHLSQYGQLPERGIVAGQSVASALQNLYGKGAGVINDVDIFRLVGGKHQAREHMVTQTAALTHAAVGGPGDHYDAMERFLRRIRSYRVNSVSRDDMLNYVNCVLPMDLGRQLSATRVIEAFDINCTRVAVDLETKQLVWDRHFEYFYQTNQLEIAAAHTPWHTFLRLLKKREELPGVFVDLDAAAEVVTALSQSRSYEQMAGAGSVSQRFGEKAQEIARAHRSAWEPYFLLEDRSEFVAGGKKVSLHTLTPRGEVDAEILRQVNQLQGASIHYCAQTVYNARRKKSAGSVAKLKSLKETLGPVKSNYKYEPLHHFMAIHREGYVEGQITQAHIDTISSFLREHYGMARLFVDMTMDQQFHCIKRLKALEKERGRWVIGALENQGTATDLFSEATLQTLLDRYEAEAKAVINVEPLVLPTLPKAWRDDGILVEELLKPIDLMEEGEEMGHCVGGYTSTVRENRARILRIRSGENGGSWSTVELRPAGNEEKIVLGKPLRVEQHRGRFNKDPSPKNKEVLAYLVQTQNSPVLYPLLYRVGMAKVLGYMRLQKARAEKAVFLKLETTAETLRNKAYHLRFAYAHRKDKAHTKMEEACEQFNLQMPKEKPKKVTQTPQPTARPMARFADMDDEVPF